MAGAQRPTVATVLGVINIIFGGFGLLGLLSLRISFLAGPIYGIFAIVSIAVSALLLATGIFLLMNKKNALQLSKYYVFISVIYIIIYSVFLIVTAGLVGLIAAIVTIIIGLIIPALNWFLLVNNEPVKKFYA
jgi:hypothetical protein